MDDQFDDGIRPDPAELEAAKAAISAFREANPTLTKTGLAVAFVDKRGSATSGELATLLDLQADQYPSVELSSAVQNGRLVRDGKNWALGPNRVAYQVKSGEQKPDALESGAELGRIEQPKPAFPVPTFTAVAKTQAPGAALKALKQELKAPGYRCALWSDGVVELQRDGQTVTALPRDAAEELARFVHGLLAERAA